MRIDALLSQAIFGPCLALLLIGPAWADTKDGVSSPDGNVIRRSWSRSVTVRRQVIPPDQTAAGQRVEPAPLPAPLPSQSDMGPDAQAVLYEHNRARAQVGARPLVWNARIATMAADHAERLAQTCRLEHSGRRGFGENLFVGTAGHYTPADGARSWIAEGRDYDYRANSGCGKTVGHYTQVVWADTAELGCGRAVGCGNMWLVCNYYPPGNYAGRRPY